MYYGKISEKKKSDIQLNYVIEQFFLTSTYLYKCDFNAVATIAVFPRCWRH